MNIKEAKQIRLVEYLRIIGHSPVNARGCQYWYLSPLREERTPSFKVNDKLNEWYDLGLSAGGDIIELGKHLYRTGNVSVVLLRISENAIQTAGRLVQVLEEAGFSFYLKSPTNQQFVILENRQMERLAKKVAFSFWETLDEDHTAVRFVTSWAADPQNLEALWEILAQEAGQKA